MEGVEDISQNSKEQLPADIKSATEYDKSQQSAMLDEVMRVEAEAWPAEWQATRDKFEARVVKTQ